MGRVAVACKSNHTSNWLRPAGSPVASPQRQRKCYGYQPGSTPGTGTISLSRANAPWVGLRCPLARSANFLGYSAISTQPRSFQSSAYGRDTSWGSTQLAPHHHELLVFIQQARTSDCGMAQVRQGIGAWISNYGHYASMKPEMLIGSWELLWSDGEQLLGERNLLQLSSQLLPAHRVIVQDVHQWIDNDVSRLEQHFHLLFDEQRTAIWTMRAEMVKPITKLINQGGIINDLRFRLIFQDVCFEIISGNCADWKRLLNVRRLPDGQWQSGLVHPIVHALEHSYVDPCIRITSDLYGMKVFYRTVLQEPELCPSPSIW